MKKATVMLMFIELMFSSCLLNSEADTASSNTVVSKNDSLIASDNSAIQLGNDRDQKSIQGSSTLDSLQGTWISDDDTGDYVFIHSHQYEESNIGDTVSSVFFFSDTCLIAGTDGDSTKQSGSYITMYDENDASESYCYAIEGITGEKLTLLYLGRGNLLRFHRQKTEHHKSVKQ